MDLRLAKEKLFGEFLRREARMVVDLIRNSPDETDATTTDEQPPALGDVTMTSSAHPAEDEGIGEGENQDRGIKWGNQSSQIGRIFHQGRSWL